LQNDILFPSFSSSENQDLDGAAGSPRRPTICPGTALRFYFLDCGFIFWFPRFAFFSLFAFRQGDEKWGLMRVSS